MSIAPYIRISQQNVLPGSIEGLAIKLQVRLKPAGNTFKLLCGAQLCLGRADHGSNACIGSSFVLPIRSAISAISFDSVSKLSGDMSKEVALGGRDDLRISILTIPHLDDVGVAPMTHGDLVIVLAKEKYGVKGKIIALVLRKKKWKGPGQAEQRSDRLVHT